MAKDADGTIVEFPDRAASYVLKAKSILERSTATSWEFADFLAGPDAPEGIGDGALADQLGVSRRQIGEYRAVARAWPEAERSAWSCHSRITWRRTACRGTSAVS